MSKKKDILKLDSSLGKVRRRYKGYAAAEEQKRKLVLYAAAGLVGLLVIMLAVWGVGTVITEIIAPEKVTATSPMEEKEMGEEDALVMLVLKLSDDHTAVENMVLTRFDPMDSRVYVAGVSPRVLCGEKTLAEHFAEGGNTQVAQALAEMVDCDRVYTVSVDYTSMRKVINIFGGVTITVPYAIKYDSPNNDRNLNVAPGTREYTGWEIARLLNYPNWNGGEQEQLYMYAMVASRIINEHLNFNEAVKLKNILNNVYDEADADITMTEFQAKTPGLLQLCAINRQLAEGSELAVIVDVWPEETDNGLEYTGENRDIMMAAFGRRYAAEE
ncbi:MAG: hypothetical protein E7554_01400 [Ruminococcaceae bacterium]|nr:hypothetical protein [Oscillospiraceae bacterium]